MTPEKVLFFDQEQIADTDLLWGFLECGYELQAAEKRVPDAEYADEDLEAVLAEIAREDASAHVDLIVTKDFSAVVAEACHRLARPYLSWVHDAPQRALYLKEALYETNRVFVFDRRQYERMKERGIPYVFHEPLAANVTRMSLPEIAQADPDRFRAEISFVGNLYESDARKKVLSALSPEAANECESLIREKTGNWDAAHTVYRSVSDATLRELEAIHAGVNLEAYAFSFLFYMQVVLFAQEVAMRERIGALRMLSETLPVTLYTSKPDEAASLLTRVSVRGKVSHETELPLVYRASKINLNLTTPSIETGIPLRVFEIMSVGGFVLSNRQEEIEELFVPDREIVTFSCMEELKEKAAYYLSHDREREKIAAGGFRKVAEKHTCPQAVSRMLAKMPDL